MLTLDAAGKKIRVPVLGIEAPSQRQSRSAGLPGKRGVGVKLALPLLLAAQLSVAALGCGANAQSGGGTDTSTDWLACKRDADCSPAGSECACGICTAECSSDGACEEFSPGAVCHAPSSCDGVKVCAPPGFDFPTPSQGSSLTPVTAPPECRSSCNSKACKDPEPDLADLPNFDDQKTIWDAESGSGACQFTYAQGSCAGGVRFVHRHGGKTSETRYFDAAGLALGLSSSTDESDRECAGRFYWPRPIRCEGGAVTELYCGDLGGSLRLAWSDGSSRGVELALPKAYAPHGNCRNKCDLSSRCDDETRVAFPNLAQTRLDWSAPIACIHTAAAGSCAPCSLTVVEGECDSDLRFIHRHNGTVGEVRFFDAAGEFTSLASSTDDIDAVCAGQGFWPEPTACGQAIITKSHCGSVPEQAVIVLPWAEGKPAEEPFGWSE